MFCLCYHNTWQHYLYFVENLVAIFLEQFYCSLKDFVLSTVKFNFITNVIFPAHSALSMNCLSNNTFVYQETISLDKEPNTKTCTEFGLTHVDNYPKFLRKISNQK